MGERTEPRRVSASSSTLGVLSSTLRTFSSTLRKYGMGITDLDRGG
jgi:hypothetical protein